MTIEEYFGDWSSVLNLKMVNTITRKLADLNTEVYPSTKDLFKAFKLCPLHNLRVVICGTAPYPNSKATGIAFANPQNTPEESYSASLEFLKESFIDYTTPHRTIIFEPDLEKWEAQGVLMLNSALSCELQETSKHKLLWHPLQRTLFSNLSKVKSAVVYVLIGEDAQGFEPYINSRFNHIISIKDPHYYIQNKLKLPFNIGEVVNNLLTRLNGYGIEWYKEY